jgi:hypothetical protein
MTPANIIEMILPLFTQLSVDGMIDPVMDDPSTKRGNSDVRRDKIWSILDDDVSLLSLLLADEYNKVDVSLIVVLRR